MGLRRVGCTLGLILLIVFALPWRAAVAGEATTLVSDLATKALAAANDKTLSPSDREQRLRTLVNQDFDLPRISRFVLGRYWQSASEAERQEFTTAFSDYLLRTYTARIGTYSDESFRVVGERAESDTVTLVSSDVRQQGAATPAKVDWRIIKGAAGYKITDISVGGVSLAITQREEVATSIQRNGGQLSALINQLRAKENDAAASSGTAAPR